MKKSEKIGIAIVVILAIILVSMLLAGNNKGNTKKDYCDVLCIPSGPETWSLMEEPMVENDAHNFSTKNECISACLLKK